MTTPPEYDSPRHSQPVTVQALDQWRRDGYLPVAGLFPTEAVTEVADLLDQLYSQTDSLPGWASRSLLSAGGAITSVEINATLQLEPRLASTEVFARCQDYASRLLGQQATYDFDHTIHKVPQFGSATPWHQDRAYYPFEPDRDESRVHFWIPMADVDAAGGCMRYLAGSHRGGLLPHHLVPSDPHRHYITTEVDDSAATDVSVAAGDAILHHPATLHASRSNTSPEPRTAWILHFARPRNRRELARKGIRDRAIRIPVVGRLATPPAQRTRTFGP